MRIAIISDIHSNLEALRRTFEAIDEREADRIYCLGDIVGYGPYPNECITLVRERCSAVVMGNHDSGVIGSTPLTHFNIPGRKAIKWTADRITRGNLKYLKSLPLRATLGNLTIAHASPARPESWTYVSSWVEVEECFPAFKSGLCFIGHTHRPLIVGEDSSIGSFHHDCRYLINVGSVGQPRDENPNASFGFLDSRKWTFEIVRVPYNIEKTARAIRNVGLPQELADRLYLGI